LADILKGFLRDPEGSRLLWKKEWGWDGFLFSLSFSLLFLPFLLGNSFLDKTEDIFGLLLLFSDGYCKFKEEQILEQLDPKPIKAQRFFNIGKVLPLELQMVLVRLVYLSPKQLFLSEETERALKRVLAMFFTPTLFE